MFPLLFSVITLYCCCSYLCFSAKNEMSATNDIENIIHNYVNPMKQLTANFPNHQVEIQIEFQRAVQQTPKPIPKRRFFYKQPQFRRSNNMETVATTVAPTTTSITTPHVTRASMSRTSERRPVYLEDLQRVFNEFANKIQNTKCTGDHPTTKQSSSQIVISNPGSVRGNPAIDEVVNLIRKGVHIETHVPQPTDEDLDWLQIKIPT